VTRRATLKWISRPAWDYLAAVAAMALFYVVVVVVGLDPFDDVSGSTRAILYQTLAGVAAAVLGFAITAIAIVATLTPQERIAALMRRYGRGITGAMFSCARGFALAAGGFAAMIAFDTGADPSAARYVVIGLVVLLTIRLLRLLFILSRLMTIMTTESGQRDSAVSQADAA
jgi:hypothetical protein